MKITLTHPLLGDKEFEASHAERIMARPNNGGWQFKKDAARSNDAKGKAGEKAQKGSDKSSE